MTNGSEGAARLGREADGGEGRGDAGRQLQDVYNKSGAMQWKPSRGNECGFVSDVAAHVWRSQCIAAV